MEATARYRFFSCSFSQLLSWDFRSNYLYAINYCSWPIIPLSEITTLRFEVSTKSEIENHQVLLLDRISFDEGKVFVPPGSKLICYTDGLVELENENQIEFGSNVMEKAIVKNNPMEDIIEEIIDKVNDHKGNNTFFDDISLMGIHFK